MAQLVEDWYKQMPIITRSYLTLSVLTTAGCALEVLSLSLSLSLFAPHFVGKQDMAHFSTCCIMLRGHIP